MYVCVYIYTYTIYIYTLTSCLSHEFSRVYVSACIRMHSQRPIPAKHLHVCTNTVYFCFHEHMCNVLSGKNINLFLDWKINNNFRAVIIACHCAKFTSSAQMAQSDSHLAHQPAWHTAHYWHTLVFIPSFWF